MNRLAFRSLGLPLSISLLLVATACEVRTTTPTRDGGGDPLTDGQVPSGCSPTAPGLRCFGTEAVDCLPDGSEGARLDCATSGTMCVDGLGCRLCMPGRTQCNGNDVQTCKADGTGWEVSATCDPAAGQTCNASRGVCTSACEEAAKDNSYIGCEYLPVTTSNSQVDAEFIPAVVVANPQTVAVNVTVTGPAGFNQTRSVSPGATETIELPWVSALKGSLGAERSALVPGGAYRLVSTMPVTVYQFNPLEYRIARDCIDSFGECDSSTVDDWFGFPVCDNQCFSYSNDASLLLPTHVMTGNYIVMSRPTLQLQRGGGTSASPGFFAVVGASETPVTVDIQFSANTLAGDGVSAQTPGSSATFTLNQGDVLQVLSGTPSSCTPGTSESGITYCLVGEDYDLTGTEIRASGPVQVIGGHNCSFVPYDKYACDHMEEALFPLEAWGKESIASKNQPPMSRNEPHVVRILSGADGNTITFDPPSVGGGSVTLNLGQFVEFESTENFRATGTGAFLMGQFIVGQSYHSSTPLDAQGDPSMSLGIPSEQFRTDYTFLAPSSYPTNFVNVTAPTGATVTLDGSPVSGFIPVGGSGYSVAQVSIGAGQHHITSDQGFGIVVYGYGQFTSYMYPGGLDFEEINVPF